MHIKELYKSIYRFWSDTTPLFGDCGELCGKACCETNETEETGMYLFPGEEALFADDENFVILPSDFAYKNQKTADIVICKNPCTRNLRPLSCRIFPLVPYYKNGTLSVIQDPRAVHLCPLAQKKTLPYFDPAFRRKVEKTFRLLLCFEEVRAFLEGLTEILDDYLKFDPREDML